MNDIYKKQVALLIRIMPSVYRIKDFAVHGGTAINLFHKNMPRYSVDIDLTYIPVKERAESLDAINNHLRTLKSYIEKSIPGIKVIHKHDVWKLQCTLDGATVKIEVNGTKRGPGCRSPLFCGCHPGQLYRGGCPVKTLAGRAVCRQRAYQCT